MITPIRSIPSISGEKELEQAAGTGLAPEGMFTSVFRNAVNNVKDTENTVAQKEYLMATGQLDNPAELTIAETKSAIAVEMLVQLRNKALEAYSELNRINL